jgi:hypothetical protein
MLWVFAASHRLAELEYSLVGPAVQARQPVPQQVAHASRDTVLGEELAGVALGRVEEAREMLDLIRKGIIESGAMAEGKVPASKHSLVVFQWIAWSWLLVGYLPRIRHRLGGAHAPQTAGPPCAALRSRVLSHNRNGEPTKGQVRE